MPAAVRLPGGLDDRPRIEVALRHLPADDRDLWLRIGMAIKAGMGEDGFELWDDWSRSSERYRDTDARDVWRSLRPDGGISLATLFFEAKKHGYVQSRSGKAGRTVAAPAAPSIAAAPGGGGVNTPRSTLQPCNGAKLRGAQTAAGSVPALPRRDRDPLSRGPGAADSVLRP